MFSSICSHHFRAAVSTPNSSIEIYSIQLIRAHLESDFFSDFFVKSTCWCNKIMLNISVALSKCWIGSNFFMDYRKLFFTYWIYWFCRVFRFQIKNKPIVEFSNRKKWVQSRLRWGKRNTSSNHLEISEDLRINPKREWTKPLHCCCFFSLLFVIFVDFTFWNFLRFFFHFCMWLLVGIFESSNMLYTRHICVIDCFSLLKTTSNSSLST